MCINRKFKGGYGRINMMEFLSNFFLILFMGGLWGWVLALVSLPYAERYNKKIFKIKNLKSSKFATVGDWLKKINLEKRRLKIYSFLYFWLVGIIIYLFVNGTIQEFLRNIP